MERRKFPYSDASSVYTMAEPKKAWKRLPAGDAEPFPKDATDANDWIGFRAGEFARASMEPFEAMERLDIEPANEELEE